MPLTVTDTSAKTVGNPPQSLGVALRAELDQFNAGSATAAALFVAALNVPVTVKIVAGGSATGGVASKTNVTMGSKLVFGGADTAKPDGLKELVESTIFEIQNALNMPGFDLLKSQFEAGQLTLIGYGRAKADLESQSTWAVSQILSERVGYVSSAWGTKQKSETAGKTQSVFQNGFAASPHDSQKQDTDHHSLPTAEMYSFEAVSSMARNKIAKLLNGAVSGSKATKTVKDFIKGLDNKLYSGNTQNTAPEFYYSYAIDRIAKLATEGWTITWTGNVAANWSFTAGMKKCLNANAAAKTLIENFKLV